MFTAIFISNIDGCLRDLDNTKVGGQKLTSTKSCPFVLVDHF